MANICPSWKPAQQQGRLGTIRRQPADIWTRVGKLEEVLIHRTILNPPFPTCTIGRSMNIAPSEGSTGGSHLVSTRVFTYSLRRHSCNSRSFALLTDTQETARAGMGGDEQCEKRVGTAVSRTSQLPIFSANVWSPSAKENTPAR